MQEKPKKWQNMQEKSEKSEKNFPKSPKYAKHAKYKHRIRNQRRLKRRDTKGHEFWTLKTRHLFA